jgi:hypothetical protein
MHFGLTENRPSRSQCIKMLVVSVHLPQAFFSIFFGLHELAKLSCCCDLGFVLLPCLIDLLLLWSHVFCCLIRYLDSILFIDLILIEIFDSLISQLACNHIGGCVLICNRCRSFCQCGESRGKIIIAPS